MSEAVETKPEETKPVDQADGATEEKSADAPPSSGDEQPSKSE